MTRTGDGNAQALGARLDRSQDLDKADDRGVIRKKRFLGHVQLIAEALERAVLDCRERRTNPVRETGVVSAAPQVRRPIGTTHRDLTVSGSYMASARWNMVARRGR